MAAINNGVTCIYGVNGTVANLFVQSYSISSSFNINAQVMDEYGLTVTNRYDDRKSEITIEGIAKTSVVPQLGDSITFDVNAASAYGTSGTDSFTGVVTKVDDKGSNKNFSSVSITAVSYEQI